ncbi:autotransporter outer membrane beta-barrel domain-containing protein, partial [Bordetella holmesii]|nr:autotransporter outer membrane beta-barrel domain-containing protein [Bordetella holmesii]MBO1242067.1 autotransporter outer membrane beta-barrel domain-containing protein [Bordetella holmesii]MBO1245206.1 autotransporter outer membrane beta-barrel domain-containing protein [Bordetella holmesii]MBO1253000.1 autotransporter outer membrane beta-barrel domain-containing protein [Bordetella holmesii]MBO1259287.1 autotransporter outer membrane beta-barrel domain-containing protein [Bordetella hol
AGSSERRSFTPGLYVGAVLNLGAGQQAVRYHLIHAAGSQADSFALNNSQVDIGAYRYQLALNQDGTQADDWYLSTSRQSMSETTRNAVMLANVTPTIWNSELFILRSRLGELRGQAPSNSVWGKYITGKNRVTNNVAYDQTMNGFMVGADRQFDLQTARLFVGGLFSYSDSDLKADDSRGKVDSYALGMYTTWLHDSGYYVDGVVKVNRFKTDNDARFNAGTSKANDKTTGVGVSIEAGKHIVIDSFFVEPYLQLAAFRGGKTKYGYSNGVQVEADSVKSVSAEAGLTLGKTFTLDSGALIKPYARIALNH